MIAKETITDGMIANAMNCPLSIGNRARQPETVRPHDH
jgi:hypothetical protein